MNVDQSDGDNSSNNNAFSLVGEMSEFDVGLSLLSYFYTVFEPEKQV